MNTDFTPTSLHIRPDVLAFYNALMWDIEPELTTDMLSDLDALYAGESAEDRTIRMQWYGDAFAIFRQRADEAKANTKKSLHKVMKALAKFSHERAKGMEQNTIASIEDSLADS